MIYIVLGTKAQLIKMAPIMAVFQEKSISYRLIFTSQHKEKIFELLENFSLPKPDIELYEGHKDITSLFQMGKWFLSCLWESWKRKKEIFPEPGILLVHGDTFSTLLGAVMGRLSKIKVGHVESGLRSFNLFHPFPEEITRLLTFKLSQYYFCPGSWAVENLKKERGEKINLEQNTLLDTLHLAERNIHQAKVSIPSEPFGLVSMHRYENIFNKKSLEVCVNLIKKAADHFPLLFILHLPTEKQLKKLGFFEDLEKHPRIEFRPRYDYFDFISLLMKSEFLITDGGSNQEECSYLGHPCLLLRKATERQEGLGGNVLLSNYDPKALKTFLEDLRSYKKAPLQQEKSPSEMIVNFCKAFE